MFCNKTLSDIRRNAIVDGRRKVLQSYISDIALIPVIRASKKFNQFVDLQEHKIDTQDVSLPQTSLNEIFDHLGPRSTKKKQMIPSDSFTAHDNNFKDSNSKKYSHCMVRNMIIPSTQKNKSNPYLSGNFNSSNQSHNSGVNRSQQRIAVKKDRLTLVDSFNNPNKYTSMLYSNKNVGYVFL
jgi:hypothetical protein